MEGTATDVRDASAGRAPAAALLLMPWWIRNGAMGNSEGVMVALVFATVLAHLDGRRGWAFAFGIGAALLRPEVWPFLGLYSLFLLYEDLFRIFLLSLAYDLLVIAGMCVLVQRRAG